MSLKIFAGLNKYKAHLLATNELYTRRKWFDQWRNSYFNSAKLNYLNNETLNVSINL